MGCCGDGRDVKGLLHVFGSHVISVYLYMYKLYACVFLSVYMCVCMSTVPVVLFTVMMKEVKALKCRCMWAFYIISQVCKDNPPNFLCCVLVL